MRYNYMATRVARKDTQCARIAASACNNKSHASKVWRMAKIIKGKPLESQGAESR